MANISGTSSGVYSSEDERARYEAEAARRQQQLAAQQKAVQNAQPTTAEKIIALIKQKAIDEAINQGVGYVSGQLGTANNAAVGAAGEAGASAGGVGLAEAMPAALGAYNTYNTLKGGGSDQQKAKATRDEVARQVGNYFTGGISGVAEGAFRKLAPGQASKLDSFREKYSPSSWAIDKVLDGGRSKEHAMRSAFRDALFKGGFAERTAELGGKLDPRAVSNPSGTYVPLADGSFYDISGERDRQEAIIKEPEREWTGQAIGWANPIATILAGNQEGTLRNDMAGAFTNAMRSNTRDIEGIRANALAMYERLGMSMQDGIDAIKQLVANKKISEAEGAAQINGIQTLFNGKGYSTNAAIQSVIESQIQPGAMAVDPGRIPANTQLDPAKYPSVINYQALGGTTPSVLVAPNSNAQAVTNAIANRRVPNLR